MLVGGAGQASGSGGPQPTSTPAPSTSTAPSSAPTRSTPTSTRASWGSFSTLPVERVPVLEEPSEDWRMYAVWDLPGISFLHGLHAGRGLAAYAGLVDLFPGRRYSSKIGWHRVYSIAEGEQLIAANRVRQGIPQPTPLFRW